MLVFAAVGVFGAGMLAIAAGIPIKDFGYGNTLILSGVMAWCTSAIMLTLWACAREVMKAQARPSDTASPEAATSELRSAPPAMPPGWPEAIPDRTPAVAAPPPAPAAPPPSPPAPPAREQRRNLLFSSTRRTKEAGPRDITAPPESGAPPSQASEIRPAPSEETRPPVPRRIETPTRTLRPTTTLAPREPAPPPAPPPPPVAPAADEAAPAAAAAASPATSSGAAAVREAERPARSENGNVSVLKSGVVDGMAYWLYSDGSIEAQMPEGMMRFTSIDELRAHLDKRP